MINTQRFPALIILLSVSLSLFAINNPYEIIKTGMEDGLSNNYILSITEDNSGFIWFGTDWGLNSFDGNKFNRYINNPEDVHSLSDNGINKVLGDKKRNKVWIATKRSGLNVYDGATGKINRYPVMEHVKNSTYAYGITDLCFDEQGDIWIATYGNGLKKLLVDSDSIVHYSNFGINNYIWCVTDDKKGNLYIGHVDSGLTVFSLTDNTIKQFFSQPDNPQSPPSNAIMRIYVDNRENVWLCTNNGLGLFNPQTYQVYTFRQDKYRKSGISHNETFAISEINNTLWIGTANGINLLDLNTLSPACYADVKFDHIGHNDLPTGLSGSVIRDIFPDSFGNVWIGTDRGVNFISHTRPFFGTIKYSVIKDNTNALTDRVATTLCYDKRKELLWVGTEEGGIDVYHNQQKVAHYEEKYGNLTENFLICSLIDSDGHVWFGTNSRGLVRLNKSHDRFETVELPIRTGHIGPFPINCLYEDNNRNVWIGNYSGLWKYDLDTHIISSYTGQSVRIQHNLFRALGQDINGNIWLGSLIDGLSIVTPEFGLVKHRIDVNTIHHIYRDTRGGMWVSTVNGACYFSPDDDYSTYQRLDTAHGLADACVYAITEGNPGEIWMSTNTGISLYLVNEKKFENYNHLNGIPHGAFRIGSVTKAVEGTIYFGSQDGISYFDSRLSFTDNTVPPVRITSFSAYDNKKKKSNELISIPVSNKIKLAYNQNNFVIDFNVMDYSLRDWVEYSYSMQGMDNLWYTIKGQNQVTIRNLTPGYYVFKVKARLKNHNWPEDETRLYISVRPPFWLTWWAKLAYITIACFITYFIISYYLEKRNRQKENDLNTEKLRFYTNVAHELKTPLTLIIGPLGDLKEDKQLPPAYIEKIGLIHKNASRLSDLTNQIMEFRKTETQNRKLVVERNDLAVLTNEVVRKYKELNQNGDLAINFCSETMNAVIWFDAEVITILLDNLITNAIKYTPQGSISVFLRDKTNRGKRIIEIEVRDTGMGIPDNVQDKIFERYYRAKGDQQASGTGIGLALVKNLIQLHKAQIQIKSKLKEGTSFYIQLDADNTYPNVRHIDNTEPGIVKQTEGSSSTSLLIVEDNAEIRQYIRDSLSSACEILEACNGKEGVEMAIERIPDIIISDIMMPVMDGINLCRILKEDVRTCHIPIILLTAKDSLVDKIEGYSTGADSYITKPFNSGLLQSRIKNLIEGKEKVKEFFSSNIYKKMITTDALCELDHRFMEKTTSLIEEKMESDQLNAMFLAEQHCMSYSAFSRKIKAVTGMTAHELIRKLKLRRAEQMLLSHEYTISEIATRLGFNNMSHFRDYFKAEFGDTPSRYLKTIEEGDDKDKC